MASELGVANAGTLLAITLSTAFIWAALVQTSLAIPTFLAVASSIKAISMVRTVAWASIQ